MVDDGQGGAWCVDRANSYGSPERNDRCRVHGIQLVVELENLGPVRLSGGGRIVVDRVDGDEKQVGAWSVPAQAGSHDEVAFGDELEVPLVRSCSVRGTSAPPQTRAARRASARSIKASRPCASGASGMSDPSIRASLMASIQRSTRIAVCPLDERWPSLKTR